GVDVHGREALGVALQPAPGRQPLGVELASPLLVVPPRAADVHRPRLRAPAPRAVSLRAFYGCVGGGGPSGVQRGVTRAQTLTRLAWSSSDPTRAPATTS